MPDGQDEGQFLADRLAPLIDDRQPVGVGVLNEADVGFGLYDGGRLRAMFSGDGLGIVGELAVRLGVDQDTTSQPSSRRAGREDRPRRRYCSPGPP